MIPLDSSSLPPERVVDFDIFNPPGVEECYFSAWKRLLSPEVPGVVWTTANGGHWIATKGPIVRALWEDAERLSSEVLAVTPGLGEIMQFIPLQLDPPEHAPYRVAVMKSLGAQFLKKIEPMVVQVARELIEELAPRGSCEFVTEFAEVMPVNIFLSLIDVPLADRPMLREFGKQLTRPDGSMTVEQLAQAADDYLWPFIAERMERPGDDLFSIILSQPINGRAWTVDEAKRLCRNLLFGGLDTVAAMLGMITLHLASNADDQRTLRQHPELLSQAADEFIRRFPTVSVSRNLVVDVEVDGVLLRTGEIVYIPSVLHNLDDNCFESPETVNFERKLNPLQHTTLGAGTHRCVGAGLARSEVIIFLREWLSGIPEFRLDPACPITMRGGNVGACTQLKLRWD